MPFLAWKSFMKSYITCVNSPSCGPVRKNHLKPRVCSFGDDDSPVRYGICMRSATLLAAAETLE